MRTRNNIINYNPNCGGDEFDAIEEVRCEYNYIISKPSEAIREIKASYADWGVEMRGTSEFKKKLKKDTESYFNGLALEFRKLSGLTISAVVGLDEEWYSKDDVDHISKQYWVHPHEYIRRRLGDSDRILDFNIAAYLHDFSSSLKRKS